MLGCGQGQGKFGRRLGVRRSTGAVYMSWPRRRLRWTSHRLWNVCVGGWERAERADTTERLVYPEAVNLMVNKFKVVASASAASLISNTCKYTENGLSYLIQTLVENRCAKAPIAPRRVDKSHAVRGGNRTGQNTEMDGCLLLDACWLYLDPLLLEWAPVCVFVCLGGQARNQAVWPSRCVCVCVCTCGFWCGECGRVRAT